MIVNVLELDAMQIGSVVGVFDEDRDKPNPVQIALKNDGNQWVLANKEAAWSSQGLFETAKMEKMFIRPLWVAQ